MRNIDARFSTWYSFVVAKFYKENFHMIIITINYNFIATRLATTISIMVPDYLSQYV